MKKPDEILYVAYKAMLYANINSGLLKQHISDADFYAFNEYPDLFLDVLDLYAKKYGTPELIKKFYSLNKNRIEDIDYAKKVFSNLVDQKDFRDLLNVIDEKVFTIDLPLMKESIRKNGDSMFFYNNFKTLQTNEKLRNFCYDLDNFSFTWFHLPVPNEEKFIKEILIKDPRSYTMLRGEQLKNKEYALLALENGLNKQYGSCKSIYENISKDFITNTDISILASKIGIIEQPIESFLNSEVLKVLLTKIYPKNELQNSGKIDLVKISTLDINVFNNKKNIEVFFNWLDENKKFIKADHYNYCYIYKLIKNIAKTDGYIKEQIHSPNSNWTMGNVTETKGLLSSRFTKYFNESIPEIANELKHYIMAYELSKELDKKDIKQKKIKI